MIFFSFQWISVPFALSNPAVSDIGVTAKKTIYQSPWLGKIEPEDNWLWADNFFLLVSHNFYLKFHRETVYNSKVNCRHTFTEVNMKASCLRDPFVAHSI